jgi:hypothetical protein
MANLLGHGQRRLKRFLWFISTALLVVLNIFGLFVPDRVLNDLGNGMVSVSYTFRWPFVFPFAFALFAIVANFVLLKKSYDSGKVNRRAFKSMAAGLGLMVLGYAVKLSPIINRFPIDMVAGLVSTALFLRVLYSNPPMCWISRRSAFRRTTPSSPGCWKTGAA